jgi:hypothetical protein
MERKIIFETVAGSNLYGTNHEKSDNDFLGIFIPTIDEVLGIKSYRPEMSRNEKKSEGSKNTKGDTDRKYFSLKQFLLLASEGQSKQIEMLFSPKEKWVSSSPEWEEILSHRHLFLSKKSISPFLRFAVAQSFNSVSKGQNLGMLEKLVEIFKDKKGRIRDHMDKEDVKSLNLEIIELTGKVKAFVVAGKKYELHLKITDFIPAIESVLKTYGSRSHNAKNNGLDFKALAHSYRLLFETETLLTQGKLILPLPDEQVSFLKTILKGEYNPSEGFEEDLEKRIKHIKSIDSKLPDKVDVSKINQLCISIMNKALK